MILIETGITKYATELWITKLAKGVFSDNTFYLTLAPVLSSGPTLFISI